MDVPELRKWLAEPRSALVTAVAEGACAHGTTLHSRGIELYGHALLPGEPYDIHRLVAVTNAEEDIRAPRTAEQYRYCVNEWAHWPRD